MNRNDNTRKPTKESNPPSALLVFADGFDALPVVVPNGGSEELDATIMRWLERKLVSREGAKKAA
jgi:hypothetical protein